MLYGWWACASSPVHITPNKKWWVGQPQGEEEGWDKEGRAMTRGRTYTEGRGGDGRGREGRGGEDGRGSGG